MLKTIHILAARLNSNRVSSLLGKRLRGGVTNLLEVYGFLGSRAAI
jgi:hypothetical protein